MSCHFYFSIDTLLAKIYYIAKGSYGLKNKFEYEYPLYQLVGEFYNTALETLWRLPQTNLGCFNRSAFRNVQCLHFFQRLRFQARQGKGLAQISGESVSILFLVPCGISRDDFETLP